MKKNLLGFVLVFSVLMLLPASGKAQISEASFSDVPSNHWARYSIQKMATAGVIEGDPQDHFRGNDALTRYEFVVAMSRLFNYPMPNPYAPIEQRIQLLETQLKAMDERLKLLEEKVKTAPITPAATEGLTEMRNDLMLVTQVTSELTMPIDIDDLSERSDSGVSLIKAR